MGIPNSRSYLARVLYLLSFDTPNEPAGKAFDKYLDQIPHWVWLSWIPQLLLSLQRTEAPHCKLVLLKIATVYPQVSFYVPFRCKIPGSLGSSTHKVEEKFWKVKEDIVMCPA